MYDRHWFAPPGRRSREECQDRRLRPSSVYRGGPGARDLKGGLCHEEFGWTGAPQGLTFWSSSNHQKLTNPSGPPPAAPKVWRSARSRFLPATAETLWAPPAGRKGTHGANTLCTTPMPTLGLRYALDCQYQSPQPATPLYFVAWSALADCPVGAGQRLALHACI